jgi:hypothetical protein
MKYTLLLLAAIGVTTLLVSTAPALAFPHALRVVTPDPNDPHQEHAKPILMVLGHTNEPTFGKKGGFHDGKHHLEVFLEDQATSLPLKGANLKADKYYFKDLKAFDKAKTVNDATKIKKDVAVGGVFGDPGHYIARQVQDSGIYGYRIYGTIDYFGVAQVPIDTIVFCESSTGDTTKFNSDGWFGGYGCTDKIEDIFFP